MEIEIYSDVVCPWCYLGKARLEAALATYPGEVTLRWRPFQLDPDAPHVCSPLSEWLVRKFGGEEQAKQSTAHITALAAEAGLELDFDAAVMANTLNAHRLLWFVDQPQAVMFGATADSQAEVADALHRAHFTKGQDISSPDVLVAVAEQVGIEGDRVRRLFSGTEGTAEVRGQIALAHDIGITSVPTFVFAGKYAVTGAQETGTLAAVLAEVAERERMTSTQAWIPAQRTAPACEDDTFVA